MLFSVFCRTHTGIFLELDVEVINVLIADHLGNLVNLYLTSLKDILCLVDPYAVEVGIEVRTKLLAEDLTEVRAVVAEEGCDIFKGYI